MRGKGREQRPPRRCLVPRMRCIDGNETPPEVFGAEGEMYRRKGDGSGCLVICDCLDFVGAAVWQGEKGFRERCNQRSEGTEE